MSKIFKTLGKTILSYIKSNWLMLAMCVLSAFIMWGLVLKSENPERVKTIDDVQLVLNGEADLLSRQMVVVGDRTKVLPRITVRVSTDLLSYSKLTALDVTASVDLRKVNGTGQHELSVTATSSNGEVIKVYPETVVIDVDRFSTKKVPVEITTVNKLGKGLDGGEMSVSKDAIEIEGASSIISTIVKARYELDLSSVTKDINDSVSLTLIDNNDDPVSGNEIYGEVPSVKIAMPVYHYKEIGFDVKSILENTDNLHEHYELASYYTVPEKVKVLSSDEDLIKKLKSINLNGKIDLNGKNKSFIEVISFDLAEGLWLDEDMTEVEVHVEIRERNFDKKFTPDIVIEGANDKYIYELGMKSVDVTIDGPISIIEKLSSDDIIIYIDVKDLDPSDKEYELDIKYRLKDDIDQDVLNVLLSEDQVKLTIKQNS